VQKERAPAERAEQGRAARAEVPRSSHGEWQAPPDRPDPIDLLEEQATIRVPELVPIRYGRMMQSPFAFFRGAAYVMASDLAPTPTSGMRVQLCGDAHLSNFGGFGSPERALVFDLNDFDETLPGPWEWDVKRFAASLEISARERGWPARERRAIVRVGVREYRAALRDFSSLTPIALWYSRMDESTLAKDMLGQISPSASRRFERAAAKARRNDSTRAFEKLARVENGTPRIISDPPLIVPIEDLASSMPAKEIEQELLVLLKRYRETLQDDRRRLLDNYRYAHLARKVVGVGSVGTRCWIMLLVSRDGDDPLFLQCKESPPSVLERFAGKSQYRNNGQRVVEGQRLMQATSDIFLGWLHNDEGLDGVARDFYVRQLRDWKASADVATLEPETMMIYARMCGWTLARAHARSGDAIAIGSYLGAGGAFDRAMSEFAEHYADQNERDHQGLVDAVRSGLIEAVSDL
jgi:uncharacterized protein (DUF2252 family)